jgi:Leucine-rich repeat (LRR) protein
MSLSLLPPEILYFLANYLLPEDEQNKWIFRFTIDWRNFLNTSKVGFEKLKKQSRIITLSALYADKLRTSAKFCQRVYHLIENPFEQLELHFFDWTLPVKQGEIQALPAALKELKIQNCNFDENQIQHLPRVQKLDIGWKRFKHDLDVTYCNNVVREVVFSQAELLNYQALAHLKSISISGMKTPMELSCFGNAEKLELRYCEGVTDVSCLGNIRELNLSGCSRITDVSALGRVYRLTLLSCENVKNVSALRNVPVLDISLTGVVDVSVLTNVRKLSFKSSQFVTEISGLENVEELVLSFSHKVKSLPVCKSLQVLAIQNCPSFRNFSGLEALTDLNVGGGYWGRADLLNIDSGIEIFQKLKKLQLHEVLLEEGGGHSSSFLSWNHFTNVRELALHNCKFSSFPAILFTQLRSLTLSDKNLVHLPDLPPSLGYLHLKSCPHLSAVHLKNTRSVYPLYFVEIFHCHCLREVRVTRKVSQMKILNCKELSILVVDSPVGHLVTRECPKLYEDYLNTKNIIYHDCRINSDYDPTLERDFEDA